MVQFKTALLHEAVVAVTQSLFLTIWLSVMTFFEMNKNGGSFVLGLLILIVGMISLCIIFDKEYQYSRLSSDEIEILGWADLTVQGLSTFISYIICLYSPKLCEKHEIDPQPTSPLEFLLIIISFARLISFYRFISCFVHQYFKSVFGIGFAE